MKKNNLGSYDFIEICPILTIILTIIGAICLFVAGIFYSIVNAWWYFIIIYPIGAFLLVCFYFFTMLIISLCHNVYAICQDIHVIEYYLKNIENKTKSNVISTDKKTEVATTIQKENTNILKATNQSLINTVECPNCFAQNSPTATNCSKCGCPLK